ncbi:uncharacterized protein LOC125107151 [Lutra lutra]|uniref:uncharacterized protein LOC125107151 n=1 Tax=Lutra lutra TaxID=9657 RepID=UPI001FD107E4|nr:uncharacterized protein LOC125107151 [Lutra lutra]XP_047597883.1 uncharacterized protein LOC125107151 [Lutra lutra]XP_047597884.1 uncharacterized protein LOC125107151 [Lutra lutra]XP_047597885.1 uncharacterized protein LOC125107151 [Lutra lutra]
MRQESLPGPLVGSLRGGNILALKSIGLTLSHLHPATCSISGFQAPQQSGAMEAARCPEGALKPGLVCSPSCQTDPGEGNQPYPGASIESTFWAPPPGRPLPLLPGLLQARLLPPYLDSAMRRNRTVDSKASLQPTARSQGPLTTMMSARTLFSRFLPSWLCTGDGWDKTWLKEFTPLGDNRALQCHVPGIDSSVGHAVATQQVSADYKTEKV